MSSQQPVRIEQGQLSGVDRGGVTAFLGVPYAASPVGDARFRPPAAHQGWSGVRATDRPGPSVPQLPSRLEAVMGSRKPDWDEDGCLNLNVWAPTAALTDGRPRPVLVWFHGGGFSSGSGGWDWYDGARLAEAGDIVVVTANYRLHALGYLWLPEIGANNLGAQDQGAALRWVADNIAAFGGDRTTVTVGGQSAGAFSALALALDPATGPLLRRIIVQSGPWGLAPESQQTARQTATRYLDILGIDRNGDVGAALRAVPVADLMDGYAALARPGAIAPPMFPVLGGAGYPVTWSDALAELGDKQVLIGRTEHEITAFRAGSLPPDAPELAEETEQLFGAGIDRITRARAEAGVPAHVYRFTRTSQAAPALGSPHCAELPFFFDNLDAYPDAPMLGPVTDADRELACSFSSAAADFVATGLDNDPNWPVYRPGNGEYIFPVG
ncbi:carboxylesterase family protein [Nocardia alni]|uniref:carboxylesterase family protein n=1 Tax=Nocardia alni TaxID=2815723 RepID=UPI001C21AF0F|nr:carboxylesterase family protein [Nocardia alni]